MPERPSAAETEEWTGESQSESNRMVRKPWISSMVMLSALSLSFIFMSHSVSILRATNSLIPNALIVTVYFAIPFALLVRRRCFAGVDREAGGTLFGLIMGVGTPALAFGFGGHTLGHYPGEIAAILLPVLVCSACLCALFHPWALYST